MRVNICFGINDNYCKYCAVTIASILYNSNPKDSYRIYILSDYISKENEEKLKALKKIRKFELKILLFDRKSLERQKELRITLATYYRYKIFDLINEERLIYLDSDIVVRKDIAKLFKTDFEGNLAAGVEDVYSKALKKSIKLLNESSTYINAGVMLLNLKQCVKENIRQKLHDFLETKEGINWCDQHTLNCIFQNRIKIMDLKWDHMYALKDRNEYDNPKYYHSLRFDPSINHYTTIYKPWTPGTVHNLKCEYFKYAKLTLYFKEIMGSYNTLANEKLLSSINEIVASRKKFSRSNG